MILNPYTTSVWASIQLFLDIKTMIVMIVHDCIQKLSCIHLYACTTCGTRTTVQRHCSSTNLTQLLQVKALMANNALRCVYTKSLRLHHVHTYTHLYSPPPAPCTCASLWAGLHNGRKGLYGSCYCVSPMLPLSRVSVIVSA